MKEDNSSNLSNGFPISMFLVIFLIVSIGESKHLMNYPLCFTYTVSKSLKFSPKYVLLCIVEIIFSRNVGFLYASK